MKRRGGKTRWPSFLRRSGPSTQLELPLNRTPEPDRNHHQGGRSFYFFDFDDNIAFLTTPTYLFHRQTKSALEISSREFAIHSSFIGKQGIYADYHVDPSPQGSFRHFRDRDMSFLERLLGRRQMFVEDLASALGFPDVQWKGPSWNCFYHAVFNERPIALITARGHHPETLKSGIRLWVEEGHLPRDPNYLAIYPVNHPLTGQELEADHTVAVPELKQRALRRAVEKAIRMYGDKPHRFGMSDDDPRNISWIIAEMKNLKSRFKHMSFFVIQTHGDQMTKSEVFPDRVEEQLLQDESQLSLFKE